MRQNIIRSFIVMLPVTALSLMPSNLSVGVEDAYLSVLEYKVLALSNSRKPDHSMRLLRFDARLTTNQEEQLSNRKEKTSEQEYKNVQVLKGLPQSQLARVMDFMSAALGVNCNYCHVADNSNWAWEKDDKQSKRIARSMVLMTRRINEEHFGGSVVVNCATCHQGRTEPISSPPPGQDILRRANSEATDAKSLRSLPTVDQILDKYDQSIGGKPAFEKFNSRIVRSSLIASGGVAVSQEVYMKVPDKVLLVTTSSAGGSSQGFNGRTGWFKDSQGQHELSGTSLTQLKLNAEFSSEIRLRELYTNLRVTGKERAGEHMTYVVETAMPTMEDHQKLYFDTGTGLLVRKVVEARTALGPLLDQTDYGDYREVDGIKLPFKLHRSSLRNNYTQNILEVVHNVPIEDAKFDIPAAKQ